MTQPDKKESAFGTTDTGIIAYDGSSIHVIDLKYGYGEVFAPNNAQLLLYAAGIINDLGFIYDFDNLKTISLTIYQPRIDNVSTWTCAKSDLDVFLEKAKAAIIRSEEARAFFNTPNLQFQTQEEWEDEYLTPTEKGCKWCKRKGDCRKHAEVLVTEFIEANVDDFDDLDSLSTPSTPKQMLALPAADFNAQLDTAIARVPSLPFDTVCKLFGSIRKFEDWLSAIEARVFQGLMDGETHPDYKLVQGKQGNRKWASDDEAEAAMKAMRLKQDEMYDKSIISPTAAEKLLKKRPKLWPKLQPLIVRCEGKIAVAPITDKREAYIPQNPLDMLPDLSEQHEDPASTEVECDFI
jgi:hypothetical protein